MADPISLVALGAAVGGASGKFVERAWDSGERWLKSYFADHHEKAQEKGRENSLLFLSDLSRRLESLEQQGKLSSEKGGAMEPGAMEPGIEKWITCPSRRHP